MTHDALGIASEFALITRGEHPEWEGDRILNGEAFAFRLGRDFPGDAPFWIQSLADAEPEISKLTGLPPSSIKRLAQRIRRGMNDALREAREDGRS